MSWYALTIFLSAFLLFQVQPLMAKFILPWFGGGAGVWTVCMLFFQCVLLAGYAYAHLLSSRLPVSRQGLIHIVVLGLSIVFLPITPEASWKPSGAESPTLDILLLLLVNVGVPFAVLSATGPLLSRWFSLSHPQHSPYRLYALSNAGSLLALLSYPFVIEPNWGLNAQTINWSLAYGAFVLLCGWCAFRIRVSKQSLFVDVMQGDVSKTVGEPAVSDETDPPPGRADSALWLALTMAASVMLLATTHRICQDLAVIPLLWVVPLALYLLSFILCFDHSWWYKRWLFAPLLVICAYFAVILMKWQEFLRAENQIIVYLIALFVMCMVCHGELVRIKPGARFITRFYLVVASGGALGGILVAVIAPLLLDDFWEYHLGLIGTCSLAMFCVYRDHKRKPRPASIRAIVMTRLTWSVTTVLIIVLAIGLMGTIHGHQKQYFKMSRNFYGVVRIEDRTRIRAMVNGSIDHGSQFIDSAMRRVATGYYGHESGIGIALKETRRLHLSEESSSGTSLRIGVVGLGTGTMAALTEPGDSIRFYEINPDVYHLANKYFTYLDDTQADTDVVFGDARVSLEREVLNDDLQQFDLLAIDAFTSDAVPLHLLTREALDLYYKHLAPNGVLAFHTSNNYVNLSSVVRGLADDAGLHAVRIYTPRSARTKTDFSLWVFVTRNSSFVESELVQATASSWTEDESLPIVWTDNNASIWQAMAANKYHSNGRWVTAPNEGKFVLDSARLLAYRDYLRLVELCRVLYHKTGGSRAIMVVTIDEIPKQDDRALSIEEYSMHLYDRFKLSVPGKTEGMIIVMSTNDNKASVRLPNDWPTKIRRQIKQQFARAINDGVSSKNLSEHLVLGMEVIKDLVIQTYQPGSGS